MIRTDLPSAFIVRMAVFKAIDPELSRFEFGSSRIRRTGSP